MSPRFTFSKRSRSADRTTPPRSTPLSVDPGPEHKAYLKQLIAVLAAIALVLLFILTWEREPSNARIDLIQSLIPDAVVGLIAYIVIWYFFARRGLSDTQELRDEIVNRVSANLSRTVSGIDKLYASPTLVDWSKELAEAQEIDVVARFFDGAPSTFNQDFVRFFAKNGKLRLAITSPSEASATERAGTDRNAGSDAVHAENIVERVTRTLRILDKAAADARRDGSISVFLIPWPLNYSGQCFDNKRLIFGPCEHFFSQATRAPKLLIDLRISQEFANFWMHEVGELFTDQYLVPDLGAYLQQLAPPRAVSSGSAGGART